MGSEALELARRAGKPILLSIGYSACHWCHVMAHESFEDPATAALMNELFVNIKVDREERPDLDRIYQTAHQMLTQRGGGWPLTMFLTPDDQRPFFGGTYFPPEPRHGMPAFRDVLQRVAESIRAHRTSCAEHGALVRRPRRAAAAAVAARAARAGPLRRARGRRCSASSTAHSAASASAPKFPHPMNLEFLLRTWRATRRQRASPTCRRCTWRRSRSRAWPKAASTTSWAAASAATRSTRTG